MNVSKRLFLGFTLVTVLAIVVGAVGIAGMHRLRTAGLTMYEKQVRGLEYLGRATGALKQVRLDCRQIVISSSYDDRKGAMDAKEQFEANSKEFEYWMGEANKVAVIDEIVKFNDLIMTLYTDTYLPNAEKIIDTSIDDIPDHINNLEINVLLASIIDVGEQMEKLIIGMMDLNSALAKQTSENNDETTQLLIWMQYLMLAAAVAIAVVVTLYTTKNITAAYSTIDEQLHVHQVLIDTIPYPVFYKGADSRFLTLNKSYCKSFGVEPDDLIGKTVLELEYLSPDDKKAFQAEDEAVIREQGKVERDLPIAFADGLTHQTLYSVTGFPKKDGSPGGLIGLLIDITSIKEAEAQLAIAKERAEQQNETILASIDYASKIQRNLLPRENVFAEAFSDYSILWKPRDIVGGDIYWMKNFDEGSILCVCDCTGHGTPGALLTMLVVSAFETIVNETNYKDTAEVILQLDQRLASVLNVQTENQNFRKDINDGCDLAVLFIAKDGTVTFSSGNTHVFVCDGKEVEQFKGQRLYIGEGGVKSKEDVKVVTIPANPDYKFYVASDGLYDQSGGELGRPFGYKAFKQLILENHNEKQAVISGRIWETIESYRGEFARRDDVELITFRL